MYTKPDFVKIDFNIKDNFAAYSCPYDLRWEGRYAVGECANPGGISATYVQDYGPEGSYWECYSILDAPDNYPL